jgi:hypothetical protein
MCVVKMNIWNIYNNVPNFTNKQIAKIVSTYNYFCFAEHLTTSLFSYAHVL